MNHQNAYKDFTAHFKLLISKNPHLITTTLSNIFTMRLIGNKTHGDLAEIAIPEFINQLIDDYESEHVGKKLFRSKEQEEDIEIINKSTKEKFTVSLKAYGHGPLQLSTDKDGQMFQKLAVCFEKKACSDPAEIKALWEFPVFKNFAQLNSLALIYEENYEKEKNRFNILVFDTEKAREAVSKIEFIPRAGKTAKRAENASIRFIVFLIQMGITFVKSVMVKKTPMLSSAVSGRKQRRPKNILTA